MPRFKELGIKVVAANADGDADSEHTRSHHGLSFPVAHSVTPEVAKAIGAWTGERQGKFITQATEFVLRPGAEVAASMYSTTQLGRMDPQEVVRFIESRM